MRCTSQVRRILCNSAPAAGVRRMEFGPSGLWPIVDLRRRSIPVPSIRDALVLKREDVRREKRPETEDGGRENIREDVRREGARERWRLPRIMDAAGGDDKRASVMRWLKREDVKRDFLVSWLPTFLFSVFLVYQFSCLLVSLSTFFTSRLCAFA